MHSPHSFLALKNVDLASLRINCFQKAHFFMNWYLYIGNHQCMEARPLEWNSNYNMYSANIIKIDPTRPFLLSFFFHSWLAVRSHRANLEVRAMTGRTAFVDCLIAEVFRVFLSCKVNASRSMYSSRYNLIITLIISDRRDDATLGASGLWLGTRTRAGGTASLA